MKRGEAPRSIQLLERAVALRAYPFMLEILSRAYEKVGKLEQAIGAAGQAAAILPWRLTSRHMLAELHQRSDHPLEAFRWAREVVLIPMKVSSLKGIDLKNRSREILVRTAGAVLQGKDVKWGLSDLPAQYREPLRIAMAVAEEKAHSWMALVNSLSSDERVAAAFLLGHMPESDLLELAPALVREEIRLAFKARESPLYDSRIPEQVFLNYVLPYAQAGEAREAWRREFFDQFQPLVSSSTSVAKALKILNAEIWERLGVTYDGSLREKSFQSPSESVSIGNADCVGLSIILADACRAVGILARLVAAPGWIGVPGGHVWVEIYDSGRWSPAGASDFSKLDEAWFTARASRADPDDPKKSIYAPTFDRQGELLRLGGGGVYWQNITDSYRRSPGIPAGSQEDPPTTRQHQGP